MSTIVMFSILDYVQAALKRARYEVDENDVVVAHVPNASGFFSQGESFEEARDNLRDAIEGNVILALQLGLPIPPMEDIVIEVQDAPAYAA
ncbi:MAG: type II toxin-antitoxin system HicB family antitoxin [Chloroflexi bacterium]|nr:MAG: type II toxin-antitoxin system HicB family antitoxin [Chloroflexota bacterium]